MLQAGQLPQQVGEVGVLREVLPQQLPQVLDGEGYALDEVRLLLEITPEAVGTQHLQGAEEHEVTQLATEIALIHRHVFAQRRDVVVQ